MSSACRAAERSMQRARLSTAVLHTAAQRHRQCYHTQSPVRHAALMPFPTGAIGSTLARTALRRVCVRQHSTAQHSVPQGMALGHTAGQALRARGTAMRRKGPQQLAE